MRENGNALRMRGAARGISRRFPDDSRFAMRVRVMFAGLVFCLTVTPAFGEGMLSPLSAPTVTPPAPVLPVDPGGALSTRSHGSVTTGDGQHSLSVEKDNELGLLVPDFSGNYVLVPGGPRPAPDPAMVQAQELRLKVRELAAQLLDTWPGQPLTGVVALPTTFVSLDNFQQTSGLGRYMAEALFYEFNTRGFATREYRTNGTIHLTPGQGEFTLSRALPDVKISSDWGALVVGTYYRDKDAVFVNARLVRPSDGLVLRAAQIVLPMNSLVARMSAQPPRPPFTSGSLRIVQGNRK